MTDTFPRRNLPNEAVPWGRALEGAVVTQEKALKALEQGAKSENRATAAVTADLARQLDKLTELLEGLEEVVEGLEDLLEELQELYEATPRVVQVSETTTGFGLSGVWMTVQTVTVTPPADATDVTMTVLGSVFALGSNDVAGFVGASARILINNVPSPLFEATTPMTTDGTMAIAAPQFSRTFATTEPIVVECQMRAAQAAEYPPNAENYSALSVIASFTG